MGKPCYFNQTGLALS